MTDRVGVERQRSSVRGAGPSRRTVVVREQAGRYAPRASAIPGVWPSEKDLSDAWESGAASRRGQHLRTIGGLPVTVLDVGARNSGDGPDFLGALIAIAPPGQPRRIVRGDVEMHLRAADWFAHGHEGNPAFASVILHVVGDAQGMPVIAGAPVLEMRQEKRRKRNGARAAVQSAGGLFGQGAASRGRLAAMLDALGDARLIERAAALEGDIAVLGPGQALYEALLRGLGYTRNMTAFQETARLMPLSTLRGLTEGAPSEQTYRMRLTGLLFGTAGLLPMQRTGAAQRRFALDGQHMAAPDEFTVAAEAEWTRYPGLESLPPGSWRTFRVRPDNQPVRRMGAAVHMMGRWFRGHGLPEELRRCVTQAGNARDAAARLVETLTIPAEGYWAAHRDFGVDRRGVPSALLGRSRALDMAATAVLPFLLALADLESDHLLERLTRQVYAVLPGPGGSAAARRARHLIAGATDGRAPALSARRYQGFLGLPMAGVSGTLRETLPSPEA